jgi:signal transduction histidine kinase
MPPQQATPLADFGPTNSDPESSMPSTAGESRTALTPGPSEIQSASAQIRSPRRFLTHILDHLRIGVLVINETGQTTLANRAAIRLLGMDETASDEVALPPALKTSLRRLRQSEDAKEMMVCRSLNNGLLSLSLSRFSWPGDNGAESGILILIEDITEPVRLGVQRERTQTISAMGEMAAEVAHQLRNPLGGIELFTSILGREVSGDDGLERLVDNILGGVKEINQMITNYLALARPPQPVKEPVDLGKLVGEALSAADEALQHRRIQIQVKSPDCPVAVEADAELILQVFLNVILNAIEALAPAGRLTVTLRLRNRKAEVVFSDTGCGVSGEDLQRLFNPFFTTKDKKLGLGLAVSHQIVDAHHGLIQVKSQPGRGTTVIVALPALVNAPKGRNQH